MQTGFDPVDFYTLANSTDEHVIRFTIERIFKAFDFDQNGVLTFDEINFMLQKFLLYKSQADGYRLLPE